jgi:hypothetical protein
MGSVIHVLVSDPPPHACGILWMGESLVRMDGEESAPAA